MRRNIIARFFFILSVIGFLVAFGVSLMILLDELADILAVHIMVEELSSMV